MAEPKDLRRIDVPPASERGGEVLTSRKFAVLQAELTMRSRMQSAIAELGQVSLTKVDVGLLIAQTCALVADTLEVPLVRMLEYIPGEERLVTRAMVGSKSDEESRVVDSEGLFSFLSADPVVFADLSEETRFDGAPVLDALGVVSGISVRLSGRDEPFGVLGVYTTAAREFAEYEIEFVKSMGSVLAAAIESKRTREALEETRAQITQRERLAGIGSWVWSRGKREWQCSEEIYRLAGLDPGESVDYATVLARIHPEDRSGFARIIEEAFTTPGEHVLQHRVMHADGEPRIVRTMVQGVFGSSTKPVRIVGITQDLTPTAAAVEEKVRLSALIEVAAAEWRMTCDAIDAVVMVLDRNATIMRLNERARELLQVPFDQAVGRELPPGGAGELWSTVRELSAVVSETHLAAKSDAFDRARGRHWEISVRHLAHERVSDERIVVVAIDVTEQANREKVRREVDILDSMTQFIDALITRARDPLGVLSDLLSMHLSAIELTSDELRKARAATWDLSGLFRQLGDFAQPFSLDPMPKQVTPIIERAVQSVEPLAFKRRVGVEAELEETAEILMNEERLEQLFRELLNLFINRAGEGSTVYVTVDETSWRREKWVNIFVSTSGSIFSPEELRWALDQVVPHIDQHDALRLSVLRRIVDEHGGNLLIANRSGEQKSIASLRLPPFRRRQ